MLKDGKRKTNIKRKVEMAEKEDTPSEHGSSRNPSDQDTGRGIGPEWKAKRTHPFMSDERRKWPSRETVSNRAVKEGLLQKMTII